jgi:hypothetical protein
MKIKTIILALSLVGLSLFVTQAYGQARDEMGKDKQDRVDSLQQVLDQKGKDEDRMAVAKNARKETKAKAREAQRVEQEASDAARESRSALRIERKAQKARKNADRQAQRASKARDRSNKN